MQTEVTGERCGFRRDTFHHVAVAADGVGPVVDNLMTGLIEMRGEPAFGDGHADGIGETLAERAGGGFDAGCVTVFRMTGRFAVPLPEILQFVQR